MSMKYIFTEEELTFLKQCSSPALVSGQGPGNIVLNRQDMTSRLLISQLIEKGYMYLDRETLVIEPLAMVFSQVLAGPKHLLELPDGVLYDGGDLLLWVEEDCRRLYGKIVSAFPSLEEWYQSISEEQVRSYTIEECQRKMNQDE